MSQDNDVLFEFDKYNNAKLIDRKTTIASSIINALFMVPGNLPSYPTIGANVKQYFYKEETALSAAKIKTDLEAACGKIIHGALIGNVDFSVQKTTKGDTIFLLIIMVKFSPTDEEMLGITMKETLEKYVRFNFEYVNMDSMNSI